MINATPTKLRSGDWGAKVQTEQIEPGDTVQITTQSGKSWTAEVTRVVWQGNGVAICATRSLDPKPPTRKRAFPLFKPCGYPGCNPGHCDECDGEGRYGEGY